MKESFARIATWAKQHPWLAAGIVLVVISLGYLVYRRSRGGGSSGKTFAEMSESSTDVSPIPGMEGIPSPVTGGGGSSTPSSDLDVSPMTGQASPASFPAFSPAPPASASEFGSGWTAPDLGETVSASFAPSLQSAKGLGVARGSVASSAAGGVVEKNNMMIGKASRPGGDNKGGLHSREGSPAGVRPPRQPTTTSTNINAGNIVKKSIPYTPLRAGRTPAENLGLYWLYTGFYNGLWYSFGYPTGFGGYFGSQTGGTSSIPPIDSGTLGGGVAISNRPPRTPR